MQEGAKGSSISVSVKQWEKALDLCLHLEHTLHFQPFQAEEIWWPCGECNDMKASICVMQKIPQEADWELPAPHSPKVYSHMYMGSPLLCLFF